MLVVARARCFWYTTKLNATHYSPRIPTQVKRLENCIDGCVSLTDFCMFKNNCTNYVAYIYHVARLTPKPDLPPLFCERLSVSRGHREDWETMGRLKSSDPLEVSRASNGLWFGPQIPLAYDPHKLLSAAHAGAHNPLLQITSITPPLSRSSSPALLQKRRPKTQLPTHLTSSTDRNRPLTDRSTTAPLVQSRPSSLSRKRPSTDRRASSESVSKRSIFSLRSQRTIQIPATVHLLAAEVLDQIFSYLDQPNLASTTLVSKHWRNLASTYLYRAPRWISTYRLAQFTAVVTHAPNLARHICSLDFSGLYEERKIAPELAGWREWKFRTSILHTAVFESKKDAMPPKHPPPSKFLTRYSDGFDIPMGLLLHLLTSCTSLQYLILPPISVSPDYFVLSHKKSSTGPPTAFTGLLFVSDVPKNYTWLSGETKEVTASHIMSALTNLKHLRGLKIEKEMWISENSAKGLIRSKDIESWEYIEFRGCGYENFAFCWDGDRGKLHEWAFMKKTDSSGNNKH